MIIRARSALLLLFVTVTLAARLHADEAVPRFEAVGVPFIEKYCADCHSSDAPEADLALDRFQRNDDVIRQRKVSDRVVEMVRFGLMPPEEAEAPTKTEVDAFLNAITEILDDADRRGPPTPGRVTMRRLNRREYANTVRDLVGIDFDPTEDFPRDDVGHGFDNIGDVLTLPPLLMERYMAAAESIAKRAMSTEPPIPPQRVIDVVDTEPYGFTTPVLIYRPIKSDFQDDAILGGPVSASVDLLPGAYTFRTRAYADAPEDQVVRVAILACGSRISEPASDDVVAQLSGPQVESLRPFRILQTTEVKSRQALFPLDVVVDIPPLEGIERIAIALYRPAEGESAVTVYIDSLTLIGPKQDKPVAFRQLVDRDPEASKAERTRAILSDLASRAYRRPATDEEVNRLVALVEQTEAAGESWEDGIRMALEAVLVSPKFLFRVELDDNPEGEDAEPIDEFQLASRLSYFLWSTMPDEELFSLAAAGRLRDNLDAQTRRMLADPRSIALVDDFAMQWLQLERLSTVSPDPNLFPSFDDRLRKSMLEETRLFVRTIIEEDRSVLDFLGANFTYLNDKLAEHYGIRDTNGDAPGGEPIVGPVFRRVSFDSATAGGLLKQASILTVTSNPSRTSPVKRGLWVLDQLLGMAPPPPPPDVPELDDEKAQLTGTLRERMEQHRRNPSCATCHAQMDPIGFAFENYDAIGKFRLTDGDDPIDPAGVLPDGKQFDGPDELIEVLKGRRDQFVRCLAEKMLTYATGRGLEPYDRRAVNRIVREMEDEGDRFSALVLGIVRSEPFQMRRGG